MKREIQRVCNHFFQFFVLSFQSRCRTYHLPGLSMLDLFCLGLFQPPARLPLLFNFVSITTDLTASITLLYSPNHSVFWANLTTFALIIVGCDANATNEEYKNLFKCARTGDFESGTSQLDPYIHKQWICLSCAGKPIVSMTLFEYLASVFQTAPLDPMHNA